jgi:hypothetical protein
VSGAIIALKPPPPRGGIAGTQNSSESDAGTRQLALKSRIGKAYSEKNRCYFSAGTGNHEFIALLTALFGYLILQFCETRILIFAKF